MMSNSNHDDDLGDAIDQGYLDSANEQSPELAEQWAAHQKVESLFANLRGAAASDEPEQEAPLPSEIGPYQVQELLGQGTFGNVYLGYDAKLERQVAIKTPRQSLLAESSNDQFLREARTAAQLNHPNIVSVFEVAQEEDRTYIVSDFVDGVPMDQWRKDDPLKADDAAKLCLTISAAVAHAHEQGVIHRDLKPSNIMMDKQDNPFVMDFGLAKRQSTDATMTMEGKILGTPAYMSPEQARGDNSEVDARADVYALGVILFELLTGERPFRGSTQMLLYQVIHEDAPDPRKLNSHVPRDLSTICLKCLEKSPDGRYSSVNDFAEDITRYLEKRPITARPLGRVGRTLRWCRRRPLVAGLSTAVVISLLAGTSISLHYGITADQQRVKAVASEMKANKSSVEAERQRDEAQDANKAEITQRKIALKENELAYRSAMLAMTAIDELTKVGENERFGTSPTKPIRKPFLEKAKEFYTVFIELVADKPELRYRLAKAHTNLGIFYLQMGEISASKVELDKSITIYSQLVRDQPGFTEFTSSIASAYLKYGYELEEFVLTQDGLSAAGTLADNLVRELKQRRLLDDKGPEEYADALEDYLVMALEYYHKALAIAEQLVQDHPDVPLHSYLLANSNFSIGSLHRHFGRKLEAVYKYEKAINIYMKLINEHPRVQTYFEMGKRSFYARGSIYAEEGLHSGAHADGEVVLRFFSDRYAAASLISLASGAAAKNHQNVIADNYGKQAVQLLVEARSLGDLTHDNGNMKMIEQNADFAPLADRVDFQELCDAIFASYLEKPVMPSVKSEISK